MEILIKHAADFTFRIYFDISLIAETHESIHYRSAEKRLPAVTNDKSASRFQNPGHFCHYHFRFWIVMKGIITIDHIKHFIRIRQMFGISNADRSPVFQFIFGLSCHVFRNIDAVYVFLRSFTDNRPHYLSCSAAQIENLIVFKR